MRNSLCRIPAPRSNESAIDCPSKVDGGIARVSRGFFRLARRDGQASVKRTKLSVETPGWTRMPLSARIVMASCDRAWTVVATVVSLAIVAMIYAVQHFAITAESLDLISPNVSWRQDKEKFERAFPQLSDLIVVVVDGATPELAEIGAGELAARLTSHMETFRSVRRPDGGPYFEHNGLLLLPLSEVEETAAQLISAQPFLGPLAADPSLRGVMNSLSTALEGVQRGEAGLGDLEEAISTLADTLEPVSVGKSAFFSWRTLISGKPAPRETRRLILVQPVLDLDALSPGGRASDTIRQLARDAGLDVARGVRVRLTGPVALADEEFSTLTEHLVAMTAATIAAVLFVLWLAVRSFRIMACIIVTTLLGLVLTAALGLLLVGRFNLISVAFIPVFVGLGIDFAIQFSVRFRNEHLVQSDRRKALIATGSVAGRSLTLAGAAIAAGFFSFLPTTYVGASELGLIAGIGMAIAVLLSTTLLPALLLIMACPAASRRTVGLAVLAPLDYPIIRQRKLVLAIAGASAVISLAMLPLLRFDFNPLHLKNSKVESVSTLTDLMSDPDRSPNTIDVLAPSLATADALAIRLSRLPEVAGTADLTSFIPRDQTAKLALIGDAAALLDLTLDPPEVRAPPTDAEVSQSLAQTAESLRLAAASASASDSHDALRLATVLERLAAAPDPALRIHVAETLIAPLKVVLSQIRASLSVSAVTLQSLPDDLVADWVAKDGRARVQVFPKGDSNDNKTLRRFARAVQTIAPDATGAPISMQGAARMIVGAFIQAGIGSFVAVTAILALALRRARDLILTLIPILLTGLLTLASCVILGQPLNFANIIALPLLFGVGVAFNIYFVVAWRAGATNLLCSSLARAVVCSALTTGAAFGGLCLSSHPGTASMGQILIGSLAWTLVTVLLFEPALLGARPREVTAEQWGRGRRELNA
jgi:uncharacterized protein